MKLNIEAHTPEWHAKRAVSITATDVPAILGLSSYKSALDVYARITGKVEPEALEDNPYLRWGRESEALNAKLFAEEADREVQPAGGLWQDDDRKWLLATPDFLQTRPGAPEDIGVLETKAPSVWNKQAWEEGIPLAFQCQAVTQMVVTGARWGSCSALLPPEVVWDDLTPSPGVVDKIITAIEQFWMENIIRDTPPKVVDRKADLTLSALRRLHPKDSGATVELSPEGAEAVRELVAVSTERKAFEQREKELKAKIQLEMGEATFGVIPGTTEGYSWKHQVANHKAKPACTVESRVFRFTKKIGG